MKTLSTLALGLIIFGGSNMAQAQVSASFSPPPPIQQQDRRAQLVGSILQAVGTGMQMRQGNTQKDHRSRSAGNVLSQVGSALSNQNRQPNVVPMPNVTTPQWRRPNRGFGQHSGLFRQQPQQLLHQQSATNRFNQQPTAPKSFEMVVPGRGQMNYQRNALGESLNVQTQQGHLQVHQLHSGFGMGSATQNGQTVYFQFQR